MGILSTRSRWYRAGWWHASVRCPYFHTRWWCQINASSPPEVFRLGKLRTCRPVCSTSCLHELAHARGECVRAGEGGHPLLRARGASLSIRYARPCTRKHHGKRAASHSLPDIPSPPAPTQSVYLPDTPRANEYSSKRHELTISAKQQLQLEQVVHGSDLSSGCQLTSRTVDQP